MLFFRAILAPILAHFLILCPLTSAMGLFERDSFSTLERRQSGPAVGGNICATLDLTVLGITIVRGVCICAAGGVLTPESLLTIDTQVRANEGILATPINILGGLTNVITRVASDLLPLVLGRQTSCRAYPTNSVPNSCGSCGFRCADNYELCGTGYCVAVGAPCISGRPGRRRDLQGRNSGFVCPTKAEACLIPSLSGKAPKHLTGRNYECIETQSDLESCGGCTLPLPDHPLGQDCTAIPNAASVSCHRGACVIESCEKGYQPNASAEECVDSSMGSHDYWSAIKEASRVIVTA